MRAIKTGDLIFAKLMHGPLWGRVQAFVRSGVTGYARVRVYHERPSDWWYDHENVDYGDMHLCDPERDSIPEKVIAAHMAWTLSGEEP